MKYFLTFFYSSIFLTVILAGIFSCTLIFSIPATAHAFDDYTVLVPLPNTTTCGEDTGGNNCTTTFARYLPAAFNLAIGIAAVMAFVMITFGGIEYMTTDAIGGKGKAREHIENAIWGLVLVIGAYAILYTINPQILNFKLNAVQPPNIAVATPTVTAGVAMTPDSLADDATVRAKLTTGTGITVNAGPCSAGQTKGCTNLNGLPDTAVNGLINLNKTCACNIEVTGGTEGGHITHGAGAAIVDLAPNSAINSIVGISSPYNFQTVTKNVSGQPVTFMWESSPAHWHVVFK